MHVYDAHVVYIMYIYIYIYVFIYSIYCIIVVYLLLVFDVSLLWYVITTALCFGGRFEAFLAKKWSSEKRFGLEGCEVSCLSCLLCTVQ